MKLRAIIIQLLAIAVFGTATIAHARVLPPVKASPDNVGLIFVQGAAVDVDSYEALALEIQQQSQQAVWVSLVNFPLYTANPLLYTKITDQARDELRAAGMTGDIFYIVGHSLGGTVAQLEDANLRGGMELGNKGVNPPHTQGMIMLGSYVTRSNQFILHEMPILTLSGELDGMARIGRIAEAYARQIDMAGDVEAAKVKSPVVVLPGIVHRQYFTGIVPPAVAIRDLASNVSDEEARREMGHVISAFLDANLIESDDAAATLKQYVQATGTLVRPLIDAMWLEGSYHLQVPCTATQLEPVDQNHCQMGSHWMERAAEVMAGPIPNVRYHVENTFHESWRMFPFYHAHILNSCTPGTSCVMRLDNVGQNVYSAKDELDTAHDPVAADEMRVKMKSRQSIDQAAGLGTLDFHVTDEWDACAAINQKALDWAIAHAPASTLKRYRAEGLQLTMGSDIEENGGPTFIWSPAKKEIVTLDNGSQAMQIRVQTMRTPLDNGLMDSAAGYHYCKLISPAWFMEWIYTDSLRPQ